MPARLTRIASAGCASATLAPICGILYAANEVLAQVLNTVHNLSFYLDTMRRVRHSIHLGKRPVFFPVYWSRPNLDLESKVSPM
jgi:queuine/archaeosine tRNA-ribosyltransferase